MSCRLSRQSSTSASRSEYVAVTCNRSVRWLTRQLIRRSRSPGANGRTPATSTPAPWRRDRCSPTSPSARGTSSTASKPSRSGQVVSSPGRLAYGPQRSNPYPELACSTAGPTGRRPQRSERSGYGTSIGW